MSTPVFSSNADFIVLSYSSFSASLVVYFPEPRPLANFIFEAKKACPKSTYKFHSDLFSNLMQFLSSNVIGEF